MDENRKKRIEVRKHPKENPHYDPQLEEEYLSRADRPEWNIVGLVGQVHVMVDTTVSPGCKLKAVNGIGTKADSDGYGTVMSITKVYNREEGYGVAKSIAGIVTIIKHIYDIWQKESEKHSKKKKKRSRRPSKKR
ncbi:peptidase G2 autoproteolytic cleavage domain-containing protein [Bacillus atrophaeus]|uniref:peptidase G2 autoproteolytic cleavage domain-containing protein n=1 Tax=Bacillus atrophaeus TaxID=1452 RepID=UPI002DBE924B|nr:peptidase G2 autoproteolytic cleavage domain-containing protein [Bacillus atrophaeus]MEC2308618.1 peptidase G2 autoproteolytic cleavage domain-containing protein [Bacillus atrophaeus]